MKALSLKGRKAAKGTYHQGWIDGRRTAFCGCDAREFYPMLHAQIDAAGWTDYLLGLEDGYES